MIGHRVSTPPVDPDEAASWWSARRRLGLLSARDEEALGEWLKLPANYAAWAAIEETMDGIERYAAMPEMLAMRQIALAAQPRQGPQFQRGAGFAAVAAAVVLMILGFGLLTGMPTVPEAAGPALRYATRTGEQKTVHLADGSTVLLNTATVLEVAYGKDRRDLRLLSGQALFDVAKDKARPFVVSAGDRRITATGTMFDVRVNPGGTVAVVLTRGHVVVDPLKRSGLARLVPELDRDSLEPGQQLSSGPEGDTHIVTADVERATGWTQGQLVFRQERLADVVDELNRYTATQLVVADPSIADIPVSGVFRMGKSSNFVAALTALYPVAAVSSGPDEIRLQARAPSAATNSKTE